MIQIRQLRSLEIRQFELANLFQVTKKKTKGQKKKGENLHVCSLVMLVKIRYTYFA